MRIPRCRKAWRKRRLRYPLSPTSRLGRERGRPGPARFTAPRLSRLRATVASCCWPGVRTKALKLPLPSTRTWLLVPDPPRPRPKASASAELCCPGSVLMSPDNGAIHHMDVPVQLVALVAQVLDLAQDARPHARFSPALKTTIDAGPFPVALGSVAPRCARSHNPQHAIHHRSVVMARSSCAWLLGRQQVFQPLPLFVG